MLAPQQAGGSKLPVLLGKDQAALVDIAKQAGHPAFRGKQLYQWLYRHAALSFEEMSSLSQDFREWLKANYTLGHSEIAEIREGSADGSKKILFRLADGKIVDELREPTADSVLDRMKRLDAPQVPVNVEAGA